MLKKGLYKLRYDGPVGQVFDIHSDFHIVGYEPVGHIINVKTIENPQSPVAKIAFGVYDQRKPYYDNTFTTYKVIKNIVMDINTGFGGELQEVSILINTRPTFHQPNAAGLLPTPLLPPSPSLYNRVINASSPSGTALFQGMKKDSSVD